MRKQSDRARVDPWNTPEYRAAHPDLAAGARALAWLRATFARRSF